MLPNLADRRRDRPAAGVHAEHEADRHEVAGRHQQEGDGEPHVVAERRDGPATSNSASRSNRAGATSPSRGFIPWNQAATTPAESFSASNAAA